MDWQDTRDARADFKRGWAEFSAAASIWPRFPRARRAEGHGHERAANGRITKIAGPAVVADGMEGVSWATSRPSASYGCSAK